MRVGIVILPQDEWAIGRDRWRTAERLGFDHGWTYDHLSWRSLAGEPWHATIPTLTAAAVVTQRMRLGTFVTSPNFRHPVPFAKEVATLDDISGGRVVLGIGSGGTGFDASVLGQPQLTARQRHERFAEFVTHLDTLLRHEQPGGTGGETDADTTPGIHLAGEWFTANGARMIGTPAQSPRAPFVLAANGPKGLALVSRFGAGWVTTGPEGETGDDWWDATAGLSARLDDVASGQGRDPASIDRYLSLDSGGSFSLESMAAFEDAVLRARDLGFTDVIVHWPRREGVYAGSADILDDVADWMTRHRATPEQ